MDSNKTYKLVKALKHYTFNNYLELMYTYLPIWKIE